MVSLRSIRVTIFYPVVGPGVQDQKSANAASIMLSGERFYLAITSWASDIYKNPANAKTSQVKPTHG
jgi:hypothetical protein